MTVSAPFMALLAAGGVLGAWFLGRHLACRTAAATLGRCDHVPAMEFDILPFGWATCARPVCPFAGTSPHPPVGLAWPLTGAAAASIAVLFRPEILPVLHVALFLAAFGFLASTDDASGVLPDGLIVLFLLAGLGFSLLPPLSPAAAIEGALVGYAGLAIPAVGFRAIRKIHGIGQMDPWLAAAAGAWTGPDAMLVVIPLACVLQMGCHAVNRSPKPFGPSLFIASATVTAARSAFF